LIIHSLTSHHHGITFGLEAFCGVSSGGKKQHYEHQARRYRKEVATKLLCIFEICIEEAGQHVPYCTPGLFLNFFKMYSCLLKMKLHVVIFFPVIAHAFLFPISRITELKIGTATVKKLFDQPIVLVRNETVTAFADFCPHRGVSFQNAEVTNDNIVCPYHGFEFDGRNGTLMDGIGIKKGCGGLKQFDCVEKDNMVYVSLDDEPSLHPVQPYHALHYNTSFRTVTGETIVNTGYHTFSENVLDMLHLFMVHRFFGNKENPEPINYEAHRENEYEGTATFEYIPLKGSVFSFVDRLNVTNYYKLPCVVGTVVQANEFIKAVHVNVSPISCDKVKVYWTLTRNFYMHPIFDMLIRWIMMYTLQEDKTILEKCSQLAENKIHSKYDKLQLLRRQAIKKLGLDKC
jgi:phenylpropionate dioxygenase-like ring-hydroxylating dioxygenase large terminal subunit